MEGILRFEAAAAQSRPPVVQGIKADCESKRSNPSEQLQGR